MRILIAGLLPYDSGKTSFAISLIRALKEVNVTAFPLKPIAGHNAWYSYGTLLRSLEMKTLAGNDAIRYFDETNFNINLINPFATLFAPIDIESINYDITLYREIMNDGYPVLVRMTIDCDNITTKSYILNILTLLPQGLQEPIKELGNTINAEKINMNNLKELINNSPYFVDNCIKYLFDKYENIIIESYNDAASPTYASVDVNYAFIITPGKALLYKGDEYRKGLSLFQMPPWLIKTSTLIKYIRPIKTFNIYPAEYTASHEILEYLKNSP